MSTNCLPNLGGRVDTDRPATRRGGSGGSRVYFLMETSSKDSLQPAKDTISLIHPAGHPPTPSPRVASTPPGIDAAKPGQREQATHLPNAGRALWKHSHRGERSQAIRLWDRGICPTKGPMARPKGWLGTPSQPSSCPAVAAEPAFLCSAWSISAD